MLPIDGVVRPQVEGRWYFHASRGGVTGGWGMNLNVRAVLKHLKVGVSIALLGAVITLFIKDSYISEVRLVPAEGNELGNLSGLPAAAAALGVGAGGSEDPSNLFMEVFDSRWLNEEVLKTTYTFNLRSWRFGAQEPQKRTLFEQLKVKNMDRAVMKMDGLMKPVRDPRTKRVTLTVETSSPDLSRAVALRATELLQEFLRERTQSTGRLKARFTAGRLKEAEGNYLEAESRLRTFARTNHGYAQSSDPGIRLEGLRLEQDLQLRRQLVTTLAISQEQALLDEKNDTPQVTVIDAANLPEEKSRPRRSVIVILIFMLAVAGSFSWENRDALLERALGKGKPDAA